MLSICLAYHLGNVLLILKKLLAVSNYLFLFKNNLNIMMFLGEDLGQAVHSDISVIL